MSVKVIRPQMSVTTTVGELMDFLDKFCPDDQMAASQALGLFLKQQILAAKLKENSHVPVRRKK